MSSISATVDSLSFMAKLDGISAKAAPNVRKAVDVSTIDLASYIQNQKLQGQVLNRVSGDLIRSVLPVLAREVSTGVIEGAVTIGAKKNEPGVHYAGIHEHGGTIQHPGSTGKLQVFEAGGETIFTMKTKPHAIRIPQRAYAAPALAENKSRIVSNIAGAIAQTASGANA
jgi:hypothetical protein